MAPPSPTRLLDRVLERLSARWGSVFAAPAARRLQICLSRLPVNDAPPQAPELFRPDADYFYPASTVKLVAAVLAMKRVAELQRDEMWQGFSLDTPLRVHDEHRGVVDRDETNIEGNALTLRHCIRRALIISENEPHNRIFEFIGFDETQRLLGKIGFHDAAIVHRLDDTRPADEQRRTPRIEALLPGRTLTLPARTGREPPPRSACPVGVAHYRDGVRIDKPMDFRSKNRLRLVDLHGLVIDIHRAARAGRSLHGIDGRDIAWLADTMSLTPGQSHNPVYSPKTYPDAYCKPMLPGLRRVGNVRVMNKLGWAYGFVTDAAVLTDPACPGGLALSVTLFVSPDGVLNNDDYQYDEIATPLIADLAEAAWSEHQAGERAHRRGRDDA